MIGRFSHEHCHPFPTNHAALDRGAARGTAAGDRPDARSDQSLVARHPASIGAEVIEDGIFLTGGGALLPGMRDAVAAESAIETRIVADPLGAVIRGAWTMLPFAATLNLWKAWGRHQRTGIPAVPAPVFVD